MTKFREKENATIISRVDINDEQSIFRVVFDENSPIPDFKSGQYTELATPSIQEASPSEFKVKNPDKLVKRAYSISSAPRDKEALEFYIALVSDGVFTPHLFKLKEGDKVWMSDRVRGHFTLEALEDLKNKDIIALSSGTGIAPFISMVREYAAKETPWRNLTVFQSAKKVNELGYFDELRKYESKMSNFHYIPTVTREDPPVELDILKGRVQKLIEEGAYENKTNFKIDSNSCHLMLCGNPLMIDTASSMFKEKGFKEHSRRDPGNIHFERYW